MQNAFFYFLRSSLIPILSADVAASATRNVHRALVAVLAVRTFPNEFSVGIVYNLDLTCEAALLAAVAFRVEFGIHDVFINVLEK